MSYLLPVDYLPHDAPMLLLETVEQVTDESAVCRVTVNHTGVLAPFLNADGALPGWYALELMAQTVGVWSGWHRHQQGKAPFRSVWYWAPVSWCAPRACLPPVKSWLSRSNC